MFYNSKSSKLTLKSLTLRHEDFFPDSKTINHIYKTKIRFNYPICSSFENICIDL